MKTYAVVKEGGTYPEAIFDSYDKAERYVFNYTNEPYMIAEYEVNRAGDPNNTSCTSVTDVNGRAA